MPTEEEVRQKQWTEQERLELAAKMDAELDEFINGLEKKRYEEGWPEDRWQEEMDKHPFFMKKEPQPGDEIHPMFEGLQKLKYDPEENTCEELALNYKEDGNFYMKHKKFRMAVYSFSEGLKAKCEKPEVLAVLYNNRSAAQYFLKNYRSSLADAQKALEYKPDYAKARWRAAQCAYELERFDVCTEICEQILENHVDNKDAQNLLKKNKAKKLDIERNKRKEVAQQKKKIQRFQNLVTALEERKIKYDDIKPGVSITEEILRPKLLPLEDFPVHLDEDNKTLMWPAAFCYPEFLYSDYQQQLSEEATMLDVLESLFAEPLPMDKNSSYGVDKVNVYYENRKVGCVHKVKLDKTIRQILEEKSFFVTGGSLLFYIVPKDSHIEQKFIHEERRGLLK
ncbi:DNA polymerase interacting tpr containing protein of 47kD [Haematobia irritans]|uniref:DNA polymerase interacting tpr containing protein of 47kD n=1 Tax=Haematobia irritans TaxID=7368 RepID=UPI003F502E3A